MQNKLERKYDKSVGSYHRQTKQKKVSQEWGIGCRL